MDLDDTLTSVFNGLAHTTSKIDKYLQNNKPELKDSFVAIVDEQTPNFPTLDDIGDKIFYIPKTLCNLNIDESLYKVEDIIQEEVSYKNYVQLKDGVYTVVDENGNILK